MSNKCGQARSREGSSSAQLHNEMITRTYEDYISDTTDACHIIASELRSRHLLGQRTQGDPAVVVNTKKRTAPRLLGQEPSKEDDKQ